MDNEHEVDPADWTWPSAEIVEVTGVTFTDTDTGETVEFDLAEVGLETGPELKPSERHAQTDEVILAWDGKGIWRFG